MDRASPVRLSGDILFSISTPDQWHKILQRMIHIIGTLGRMKVCYSTMEVHVPVHVEATVLTLVLGLGFGIRGAFDRADCFSTRRFLFLFE